MSFPKHMFIEKYPKKIEICTIFMIIPVMLNSGITPSMFLFIAWNTIYFVFLTFSDNLFTASQS